MALRQQPLAQFLGLKSKLDFFLHKSVFHFHGHVYCVCQLPESLDSNTIQCDSGSTMKKHLHLTHLV